MQHMISPISMPHIHLVDISVSNLKIAALLQALYHRARVFVNNFLKKTKKYFIRPKIPTALKFRFR